MAFLVQVMGGVVVGMVGGLWRQMTPSLPPMARGAPMLEAESPVAWDFSFFQQHPFALIFAVLFAAKVAGRLLKHSRNEGRRNVAAWFRRVFRRVSHQWFNLVVINAFTASVGVMVIQVVQQFSLTQLLWPALGNVLGPAIQAVARFLSGADHFSVIEGLVAWYNANQFKFTFWLLYSAAICDDLGLPNYKTLGRFLWQRWVKRGSAVAKPALKSTTRQDACEANREI